MTGVVAPLVVTPGEPAGVGPDLVLTIAARGVTYPLVALADPGLLEARARALGLSVRLRDAEALRPHEPSPPGTLWVQPLTLAAHPRPGRPEPRNARSLLEALDLAVDGCLAGRYAALVTGPLHKGVINAAGIPFRGHTEYVAARCGGDPVMLLAGGGLRVALATTHLPLRAVAEHLDGPRLERVLRVLVAGLRRDFGIARPRVLVLGLNPHAGEQGHLGDEEQRVIGPVLAQLRGEGMALEGPVPADTAFQPKRLAGADAVLAMYHDQGLPVLKHASFGSAVNITLGLPIVRTSVDHGTALDLAGTGRAEAGSLREALTCAAAIAARRGAA
jgi:4-hydroxythreonine-4-phosphate dehydrogenase